MIDNELPAPPIPPEIDFGPPVRRHDCAPISIADLWEVLKAVRARQARNDEAALEASPVNQPIDPESFYLDRADDDLGAWFSATMAHFNDDTHLSS